jgi:pyridoxal phosphate enzyme (YggS family)
MNELPEGVTLIAVSKYKSVSEIKQAYDSGIRDFGENKVQELLEKTDVLPQDIRWHLIGHLQRNKVKYITDKVELIHSLDSIRLVEEIEKQYALKKLTAKVLIQVNIGEEQSKTGIMLNELEELLEACEKCQNVRVYGLMAIIPMGGEEDCRHYFKDMKNIWDDLKQRNYKNITMEYLSMGMSGDYMQAISEGSNMIRVGTGIFGKRELNNNIGGA